MNELSTKPESLPSTIEDLSKFVLVGREKLTSVKAEIRAIDKLELAEEVREQKMEEASMMAEALLDAETKIGEMMKAIPTAPGKRNDMQPQFTAEPRSKGKYKTAKELGFDSNQVKRFETLANNPDLVEQVKAEARENDDLPTRTQVLSLAKERDKRDKKEFEDIDKGYMYYKHLSKAEQELTYIDTDIRELKTLIDTITYDEEWQDEILDIDKAIGKLNAIKALLMKGGK